MRKERYGDPILTIRMPAWQISGLKLVARKEKTTPSALIRDIVAAVLHENGITEKGMEVIKGQISMDV